MLPHSISFTGFAVRHMASRTAFTMAVPLHLPFRMMAGGLIFEAVHGFLGIRMGMTGLRLPSGREYDRASFVIGQKSRQGLTSRIDGSYGA